MILVVLEGIPVVYIMAPLVVVILLVAGFLGKQNKSKNRKKLLEEFRGTKFLSEDELSWFIAHDVMGAAGYTDCVVYKVDQTDKVCRQIAAFGPKNPDKMSILNPINIPFGRGIVGHVASSGKLEKIDDTNKDSRYVPDDDVRYSELSAPVLVNGLVVMVIDSEHKNSSWFKDADVEFVKSVTAIAADHLGKL